MNTGNVKGTKWKEDGDNAFTRSFGPVKATISRKWGMTPEPTEYYAFLSIGDTRFSVSISDLGVSWHDEMVETVACKKLEKIIKAHIRSWLK